MSPPDAAVSTRRKNMPFVRIAGPADYPAIRDVVIAAYGQYAGVIPPDIFPRYLADVLDLEKHASHGRLLVVEVDDRVSAFAAFYPDASVQGAGFPPGWAGGRALAVHPAVRGYGVARALAAAVERLAQDSGSPVFAFHTYSFMTSAIALYDRLGYGRAPEFDFDMAAHFGVSAAEPIMALAYLRHLTRVAPTRRGRTAHRLPYTVEDSMNTRTRPPGAPAYYLGRPAAFWLAATARWPTADKSHRAPCTSSIDGHGVAATGLRRAA